MNSPLRLAPDATSATPEELRARVRETIQAAVLQIQARHHVGEASAFAILVQASIDERSSVVDAALGILARSA